MLARIKYVEDTNNMSRISRVVTTCFACFIMAKSMPVRMLNVSVTPSIASNIRKLNLMHSTRQNVQSCTSSDFKCMNRAALEYLNSIRNKLNLQPMQMGTRLMLEIAMHHSKALSKRGSLFHQDLKRVSLGCSSFFSAENVAQNHVYFSQRTPFDAASMCIEQFVNSPEHYSNMISEGISQFVMGVYIDDRKYIWCTQIFATGTRFDAQKCAHA